jgi:PAS domain S-box-containing protein
MSARIDFEKAKRFQLDWMYNIRGFLDNKEALNEEEAKSHKNSKLGVWYYAIGKELYGDLDAIKKFEIKQIKLHKILKEILEAKSENQNELAEELYEDLVLNSKVIIELLETAENILIQNTYVNGVLDENLIQNFNKSVAWDKTKILKSKTDANGIIEYVNDVFLAVSGYESFELIEKSHNVVRHSDMPKVIFKILWEEIKNGNPFMVIVKNKAKSGKFYWTSILIQSHTDTSGNIDSYGATHKGIDAEIINKFIQPLYKKLSEIEAQNGVKSAENYLKGFLEERNRTFDDYIQNIIKTGKDNLNTGQKGFLSGIFG